MKIKWVLIQLLYITFLAASCRAIPVFEQDRIKIEASDIISSEERSLTGFTGIEMRLFGKVILTQGDDESIIIQGSDNLLPIIQTIIRNGNLVIQCPESYKITGLKDYGQLTVRITVKDLSSITVSGAALIEIEDLTIPELSLTMNGTGRITIQDLETGSLNILLNGSGWVEVTGKSNQAQIDISGTGSILAGDLHVRTADVNISGIGDAILWVSDKLSGSISGGGNISYYGTPQISNESSGVGLFKPLGTK